MNASSDRTPTGVHTFALRIHRPNGTGLVSLARRSRCRLQAFFFQQQRVNPVKQYSRVDHFVVATTSAMLRARTSQLSYPYVAFDQNVASGERRLDGNAKPSFDRLGIQYPCCRSSASVDVQTSRMAHGDVDAGRNDSSSSTGRDDAESLGSSSKAEAAAPRMPKLICFDLDYTLWPLWYSQDPLQLLPPCDFVAM